MKGIGVFDILGFIMIGLLSLYIVGVVRFGKIVRSIVGGDVIEVIFLLYGFFVKMYRGYGIDRVLVVGILGMELKDERFKYLMDIVKEKNIKFLF